MRKLAILTFQTLDGVMQAPSVPEEDRSGGFTQGGWANACWDEVMTQVGREAMSEPYDLLIGRTTYDIFSSSFIGAGSENPASDMMSNARKYVVTNRSEPLEWTNSEKVSGNLATAIKQLKQQEGPLIQVHGSWQLIQFLLAEQLIDEYRLWTFPVLVGSGKRLFANGTIPANLKLVKFATTPSGAFMNFWQPC